MPWLRTGVRHIVRGHDLAIGRQQPIPARDRRKARASHKYFPPHLIADAGSVLAGLCLAGLDPEHDRFQAYPFRGSPRPQRDHAVQGCPLDEPISPNAGAHHIRAAHPHMHCLSGDSGSVGRFRDRQPRPVLTPLNRQELPPFTQHHTLLPRRSAILHDAGCGELRLDLARAGDVRI